MQTDASVRTTHTKKRNTAELRATNNEVHYMRDTSIRESLTDKQWDRIFFSCPGAWAGNKPKPNSHGSIVIDGGKILSAVQYLSLQRLRVLYANAPLPQIWCSDDGIILGIALRY